MARDGEDDGRIMAQSQSITGRRLICSRDGGGGPAFLHGEQTTKLLALPPVSPPGLVVIDPCHPGQPNPSPEPICAVGALASLHAEAPSSSSSSSIAQGHSARPCLEPCAVLCAAVLCCAVDAAVCMYCTHTVIMRPSP